LQNMGQSFRQKKFEQWCSLGSRTQALSYNVAHTETIKQRKGKL